MITQSEIFLPALQKCYWILEMVGFIFLNKEAVGIVYGIYAGVAPRRNIIAPFKAKTILIPTHGRAYSVCVFRLLLVSHE